MVAQDERGVDFRNVAIVKTAQGFRGLAEIVGEDSDSVTMQWVDITARDGDLDCYSVDAYLKSERYPRDQILRFDRDVMPGAYVERKRAGSIRHDKLLGIFDRYGQLFPGFDHEDLSGVPRDGLPFLDAEEGGEARIRVRNSMIHAVKGHPGWSSVTVTIQDSGGTCTGTIHESSDRISPDDRIRLLPENSRKSVVSLKPDFLYDFVVRKQPCGGFCAYDVTRLTGSEIAKGHEAYQDSCRVLLQGRQESSVHDPSVQDGFELE